MERSSMIAEPSILQAQGVTRVHTDGARQLHSLQRVSLKVDAGEVVAVMGPSGSGKTTLLHLLGGLDRPDEGRVLLTGVDWQTLEGNARARFRRKTCGFVIQGFSLLPQATAAETVEAALLLDGVDAATRHDKVVAALAEVGLETEAGKLPDQLSGGQQQRVAIARAIIHQPAVILADEPTGSLDSENAAAVVEVLVAAARGRNAAVVLVTHDPAIARHGDRIVRLRSGRLDSGSTSAGRDGR
jgi:putative ABC transport system ATP-binding protein